MIKNMKSIKDKDLAPFSGIPKDAKTFRNWKQPLKEENIPYSGKHNLYRGAKLYYYLHALEKDGDSSNAEILYTAVESLESNISLLNKEDLQKDIKEAINSSIQRDINILKEIIKEII